jgi:AcrR family transcriptional regulator
MYMGTMVANDADRTAQTVVTRSRVHDAMLACISRFGLAKTTLDDIARESGVSRATIYRTFPGGREVLLQSVLMAEIGRFYDELGAALARIDDLEELLTAGLAASMRFLREHAALQTLVEMEPGLLLPQFAFHRLDLVLSDAAAFAVPFLAPHLGSTGPGADERLWSAAEHLVRIVLSYTLHPSPLVDPSDDESVRRLVRDHVLPGLILTGTAPGTPSTPRTEGSA